MANKNTVVEYDLASIAGFSARCFASLDQQSLRFLRYGHYFRGHRPSKPIQSELTMAQAQAAIATAAQPVEHAVRVYVSLKYLAGAGDTQMPQVRVFSHYEGWQTYDEDAGADDPSPDEDDVVSCMTTCIVDATSDHLPCNCIEQMYQQEALEALAPAAPGPLSGGQIDARASAVQASETALALELQDGRCISIPRAWFSFLDVDNAAQWQNPRLDGTRQFIIWPGLAKRVSIASLMAVAPKGIK